MMAAKPGCERECCEVWRRATKISVMTTVAPHRFVEIIELVRANDDEVFQLLQSLADVAREVIEGDKG